MSIDRKHAAASLVDPVIKVMHEIEGEKPYLSQMLPIIMALQKLFGVMKMSVNATGTTHPSVRILV